MQTTLLSILGGRAPKQTRQEGRVLFNGRKLSKRVKRQIGFVLQVRGGGGGGGSPGWGLSWGRSGVAGG